MVAMLCGLDLDRLEPVGSYRRCRRGAFKPPAAARATISFVAFARWDPLRDLLALQQRLERLSAPGAQGWTPPVDLYETADAYVVTAELPGLQRRRHRHPTSTTAS